MYKRDLFRGLLKCALVSLILASCVEGFYFLGEIGKKNSPKNNYIYYQEDYSQNTYQKEDTTINDVIYFTNDENEFN